MKNLILKNRSITLIAKYAILIAFVCLFNVAIATETSLYKLASSLQLQYKVLNNTSAKNCEVLTKSGLCFDAMISFKMKEPVDIKNWKIYFSHMSPILEDYSQEFNIHHVNGDLHFIEPTEMFKGWSGSIEFDVKFKAEFWHISEFDSPPNFYVVDESEKTHVIKSTLAVINCDTNQEVLPHMAEFIDIDKQFKRGSKDRSNWATAQHLYYENAQMGERISGETNRIIPAALDSKVDSKNRKLDLTKGISLISNDFSIDNKSPAIQRMIRLGVGFNSSMGVPLIIKKSTKITHKEGYQLTVSSDEIIILSLTSAGAFYGLQSVAALLNSNPSELPLINIYDEPHYSYRGFFLDVARNFRSKEFVIKILDQMAAYKLNQFHFHLGDDEGWRLEIPGLPELTQLGSKRCHDLNESKCLLPQLGSGPNLKNLNNGAYSVDDYQFILVEAKKRHIHVIPSFDMPGHSRAAVKSMQLRYKKYMQIGDSERAQEYLLTDLNDQTQYSSVQFYNDNTLNVCMDSTYRFVEKVVSEVYQMHSRTGVPLSTYHIGADETPGAWIDSPICKIFIKNNAIESADLAQYFIKRVSRYLTSIGVVTGGWSDGLTKVKVADLPAKIHANAWTPLFWDGHKIAHKMVNDGWDVILSLPDVTYFDFPYEADPKERGYYWGSRYTNTKQIFEWMPDNLPIHAEIWNDRLNNEMVLNDKDSVLKAGMKIKGIQAQLWSEMIRTDDIAEYMIFPRLLAIAERAWHKPIWQPEYDYSGDIFSRNTHKFSQKNKEVREKEWINFSQALATKEFWKLDVDEIDYRIPTVGGVIEQGYLKLNSIFSALEIEYKVGNKEWLKYNQAPIKVENNIEVYARARISKSARVGRKLLIETISKK